MNGSVRRRGDGWEYMFDAHGTAHAFVGHDAGLQADAPARTEALGEERAELIGADDVP
jgi:hypothetical protein